LGGGKIEEINDAAMSGAISYGMGWANTSSTPYRKWKVQGEEGGIRAPFIISWPNIGTSKNVIVNTPSYLIDVMPTFVAVSGAKYPASYKGNTIYPLEGRSFIGAISGKSIKEHEYMYWEHFGNRVVRKGDWKGVKHEKETDWELYNISKDNTELDNVATKEPAILNDLIAHWDKWAKDKFVLPKRTNK
jgi:arylsulfatase